MEREREGENEREGDGGRVRGGIGAGDWTRALFYLRGLERFLETDSLTTNQSSGKERNP